MKIKSKLLNYKTSITRSRNIARALPPSRTKRRAAKHLSDLSFKLIQTSLCQPLCFLTPAQGPVRLRGLLFKISACSPRHVSRGNLPSKMIFSCEPSLGDFSESLDGIRRIGSQWCHTAGHLECSPSLNGLAVRLQMSMLIE